MDNSKILKRVFIGVVLFCCVIVLRTLGSQRILQNTTTDDFDAVIISAKNEKNLKRIEQNNPDFGKIIRDLQKTSLIVPDLRPKFEDENIRTLRFVSETGPTMTIVYADDWMRVNRSTYRVYPDVVKTLDEVVNHYPEIAKENSSDNFLNNEE